MSIKFFLFGFFLFVMTSMNGQLEPDVNVRCDVQMLGGSEYAVIYFEVTNTDSNFILMWVQNWRLALIDDNGDSFREYPVNGSLMSGVALYDNKIKGSKIGNIADGSYSDVILNCSFIKRIEPNETFYISLLSTDVDLIKLIRKQDFKYVSFFNFSSENNFAEMKDLLLQAEKLNILYESNQLTLMINDLFQNKRSNNVRGINGLSDEYSFWEKMQMQRAFTMVYGGGLAGTPSAKE